VDFDDPNLPSLLALPLLGYEPYNSTLYAATRARILSPATNAFYFQGTQLHGLGSPHTHARHVWPLATVVDALTTPTTTTTAAAAAAAGAAGSSSSSERGGGGGGGGGSGMARQAALLALLPKMAASNGLVHESVHVDSVASFSRPEFGWWVGWGAGVVRRGVCALQCAAATSGAPSKHLTGCRSPREACQGRVCAPPPPPPGIHARGPATPPHCGAWWCSLHADSSRLRTAR
jgi:hypothetical protein